MFYLLNYTQIRYRNSGPPSVAVGHYVTTEHPLIVVDRWNQRDHGRGEGTKVTVLNWYRPITDNERQELEAAGIDLKAVDVSGYLTE